MDGVGEHEGTAAGDDLTLGYAVAEAEPPQHGNDVQTTAGGRNRGTGGGGGGGEVRGEERCGKLAQTSRENRGGGGQHRRLSVGTSSAIWMGKPRGKRRSNINGDTKQTSLFIYILLSHYLVWSYMVPDLHTKLYFCVIHMNSPNTSINITTPTPENSLSHLLTAR